MRHNAGFINATRGDAQVVDMPAEPAELHGDQIPLDDPRDFPPGSPGSSCPCEPPAEFMKNLRAVDPTFTIAYQPVLGIYVLWVRNDAGSWRCKTPLVYDGRCGPRWADLVEGEPIPMDNRVLAIVWDSDPKLHGGLKKFALQVNAEQAKLNAAREQRRKDHINAEWADAQWRTKIRNTAPGNRSLLQNRPDLVAEDRRRHG